MLSYLYPVRVKHMVGINRPLEIYMYCGQWQLATNDALYSDGNRYRPVLAAFKKLKHKLPQVHKVLVLGTGLGSAVKILNDKGFYPQITLVDIDKQILKWALEFCDDDALPYITPICDDANAFVKQCYVKFDMIIVDIFRGREVPGFVMGATFLSHCRRLLNNGGCLMLNYIINNEDDWLPAKTNFFNVFPDSEIIEMDINRIFIANIPSATS
jgi:spermidine synthase